MAIGDFRDLVVLLEQHPEWRAELRHLVLTDELLALPGLVQQLVEAQARTEARLEQLVEAQARTEARVDQLAGKLEQLAGKLEQLVEAQVRTEARVDQLAGKLEQLVEAQARTEARLEQLADAQVRTEARLEQLADAQVRTEEAVRALAVGQRRMEGEYRGALLQQRYWEHAPAYVGRLVRRAHRLSYEELYSLLDAAEAGGRLQENESQDVVRADAIVRGRRRADGREVYLVIEVSWGVGASDVERALRRAELLARAGVETVPVVAGARISPVAQRFAESAQVTQVTGGLDLDEPEPQPDPEG